MGRVRKSLRSGFAFWLAWTGGWLGAWAQAACSSPDLQWNLPALMPTARDRFALGDVNGLLYAVGGQNASGNNLTTVEVFNPTTNGWTTAASLPTGREDLAVGTANGLLYAVGGYNGATVLNTVEAYSPTTDSWITGLAPLPTARCNLAVGVVNGILYAVGGDDGSANPLGTVEAYDPSTNSWSTKAPMPVARSQFPMGVVNGILYVAGGDPNAGFTTSLGVTDTVQSYNPSTNGWITGLAPLPTAVETASGVGMKGLFYVAGGADNGAYPGIVDAVQAYDPSANQWTVQGPMPGVQAAAGGDAVNGIFYSVGGWSGTSFLNDNQAGGSACSPTPTLARPPGQGECFIYPSPVRGSQAAVSYDMAGAGRVDLKAWNEKAELTARVSEARPKGVQVTSFSTAGFATGVYFYALTLTYDSGRVEEMSPRKFVVFH